LQRILEKLNRAIYNRLKPNTTKSKYIANYIVNNYNKINLKIFKNIIVSIKQKLLKIEIKD